jgi:uncharacterized protein (TIGR04255 family)
MVPEHGLLSSSSPGRSRKIPKAMEPSSKERRILHLKPFFRMNHPPAHSFSHSPVEEVFCCCTRGSEADSLTLTIPPPYPGWPHIRHGIRDMIAGAGDISGITGCMLRYTDLIPVDEGKNLPTTKEIEHFLSRSYTSSFDQKQNKIVLTSTKIPNTAGSVCSLQNRPGKTGWTLIFTLKTVRPARFVSGEAVLDWFDNARAGIHELFDLIVPEEIVQTLR